MPSAALEAVVSRALSLDYTQADIQQQLTALSRGAPSGSLGTLASLLAGGSVTPVLRRATVAAVILNFRLGGGGRKASNVSTETQALLQALYVAHRQQALAGKEVVELTHISKSGGTTLCHIGARNGLRTEDVGKQNCGVERFDDGPRWYDSGAQQRMLAFSSAGIRGANHAAVGEAGCQDPRQRQAAAAWLTVGGGGRRSTQARQRQFGSSGLTFVDQTARTMRRRVAGSRQIGLRGMHSTYGTRSTHITREEAWSCVLPPANKPRPEHREADSCRARREWMVSNRWDYYANEYTMPGGRVGFEGVRPCTAHMVTVLQVREPRARLESHLKHFWRLVSKDCSHALPLFAPLLQDVSTWTQIMPAPINNYAIRSLLGEAVFNAPMGSVGPEHLEAAKGVALQYDVLMRIEDPPGSELAMRMGLGWCPLALREQAGRPEHDSGMPLDLAGAWADVFRGLNALDAALYEWIGVLAALDGVVYAAGKSAGMDDSELRCGAASTAAWQVK
ncbi:hypothetical protein HYH03_004617 [Edaphochlamys debaryana]|uniref:Uncharacterized protein n=1 Tax=Edaphochlamys debaryana TaxID=47281 RepID=A0A835Y6Y7_9CHLO|nr:hypothetical protein HYH03_004617 [Edaphochlamys debaryana]|eukprot:KAG2497462.1 hypothetical protein HYH03_004617 [Edaphochlamys debaryana]